MNKKNLTPFVATHPGEMIKDELKERGMTQKQLAAETGIKPSVLSETINGKRSVSLNNTTWTQLILLSVTISARRSASPSLSVTEVCFRSLCVNLAGRAFFEQSSFFIFARLASTFPDKTVEKVLNAFNAWAHSTVK